MSDEIERTITIPLRATKMVPRSRRALRAVKEVRDNVARHMKADADKIWIDQALNEKIWERGIQKPPKRITVKAVKYDDGLVEVSLAGEEVSEPAKPEPAKAKAAKPKAVKPKAKPKAEEPKEEVAEPEAEKPEAEE
jgi:large subunit ribosomal protein L31e